MPGTNFVDRSTVITAVYMNSVDRAVYDAIGDGTNSPTTSTEVKENLSLNNVDNTSDINKPISTAQAAGLVGKDSQTGAAHIPTGTTAQRPVTPQYGDQRANSTTGKMEWWNGSAWESLADSASFLLVAGGNDMQSPLVFDSDTNASIFVATTPVVNFPSTCGIAFCKNKLINGEVTRINQRAFNGVWSAKNTWNSGNTIAQQELCYGYDMWAKASSTDMLQVIEAGNFRPSTVHTLSGTGVTTQQITSPSSGNWTITVPQGSTNVQVEEGTEATPFEIRPIAFEMAQCQRYYEIGSYRQDFVATAALDLLRFGMSFKVTKRTTATVTKLVDTILVNISALAVYNNDSNSFTGEVQATAAGTAQGGFTWQASAVL